MSAQFMQMKMIHLATAKKKMRAAAEAGPPGQLEHGHERRERWRRKLLFTERMAGPDREHANIARQAHTSLSRPTKNLQDALIERQCRDCKLGCGDTAPGGAADRRGGRVMGAIGVSRAMSAPDEHCVQAGPTCSARTEGAAGLFPVGLVVKIQSEHWAVFCSCDLDRQDGACVFGIEKRVERSQEEGFDARRRLRQLGL